MSPTAWPLRPNPATKTSSFSSMKVKQPSLGTKAVIFLPFLMSWTRTHFRMAELGCLASTPLEVNEKIVSFNINKVKQQFKKHDAYTFSRTMPLAWDAPPKGLAFQRVPKWAFLYSLSCHLCSRRWLTCLRAVRNPRGLPIHKRNERKWLFMQDGG